MIYGYARVSTPGQDYERQVEKLKAAGCDHIFSEAKSGAHRRKRPELDKAIAALKAGDRFVVTDLNRFARSAQDALNHIAVIMVQGADFLSLAQPWADTTTPAGKLMATIFLGFAEFDREQILERTAEGRANAKAKGVRFGRPPLLTGRQRAWALMVRKGEDPPTVTEMAAVLGCSKATLHRLFAAEDAGPTAGEQMDLEQRLREVGHGPACGVHAGGTCTCTEQNL